MNKRLNNLFLLLFISASLFAQIGQKEGKIELDPQVRVGKLENGLTYYIRHNGSSKDKADFYIAHNVGAIQELDNQDGLAHFLEHLAFNGLKHFPGNSMREFLATNGVSFGANINAYTSKERTVYNISDVPLNRSTFVDSVLLVLHDWSSYILCEQEEIDKERGVIQEEWRLGDNSKGRMYDCQSAFLHQGSIYAERTVIGDFDIISNFERQTLIDFYHKWYRPDLQAVIVVGDIDVDDMEKRITKILSPLPKIENGAKKDKIVLPPVSEPQVIIHTDPDIHYVTSKYILRQPFPTAEEVGYYSAQKHYLAREIVSRILSTRFQEAAQDDKCNYRTAVVVNSDQSNLKYNTYVTILPKSDTVNLEALKDAVTQVRILEQHLFTEYEFAKAKEYVYKSMRLNFDISEKEVTNEELVSSYVEHFTMGTPYIYPTKLQEERKRLFDEIDIEYVKNIVPSMIGEAEEFIMFTYAQSKIALTPNTKDAVAAIQKIKNTEHEPFYIKELDPSLIKPKDLSGSKIKRSHSLSYNKAEEWVLENGTKIVWTPTAKSTRGTDMIVSFISDRGYNIFETSRQADLLNKFIFRPGLKDINRQDLEKITSAFNLRTTFDIGKEKSEISGMSGEKDFETMLGLIYLQITEPNFAEKEWNNQIKDVLKSLSEPKGEISRFRDTIPGILYSQHPWIEKADSATCLSTDAAKAKSLYSEVFFNMKGQTIYITGTMNKEEIIPLVEKYIGSLPNSIDVAKKQKVAKYEYIKGNKELIAVGKAKDKPKALINCIFHGDLKYNADNNMVFEYLRHIMSVRYSNVIREEKGGTYHVATAYELTPKNKYIFDVSFETNLKQHQELLADVRLGLEALASEGPTAKEMEDAQMYLAKSSNKILETFTQNVIYWHHLSQNLYENKVDIKENDLEVINSVKAVQVRKLAKLILNQSSFTAVYTDKEANTNK